MADPEAGAGPGLEARARAIFGEDGKSPPLLSSRPPEGMLEELEQAKSLLAAEEGIPSAGPEGQREAEKGPEEENQAKRRRLDEATEPPQAAAEAMPPPAPPAAPAAPAAPTPEDWDADNEFEALLEGGALGEDFGLAAAAPPAPERAEEAARRGFAERLASSEELAEAEVAELLATLQGAALQWGAPRRMRSVALLLVCVARSPRPCRAAFVATEGLPLLGALLQDSVTGLEGDDAAVRQESGMRVLACLGCLWSLPLGRATMWEHRLTVGKAFDRLHRWCGQAGTALAAELRVPTLALSRRWRQQPRPALQDPSPEQKAVRTKVMDMIQQGLNGIGSNSPASPALPCASPFAQKPSVLAAEIEVALYALHKGATSEYRQHARMLRSNLALPGNTSLRARVLSSEVLAEELVAMDSKKLAPESLQEKRRMEELEAMRGIVDKMRIVPATDLDEVREQMKDHSYNPSTAPPIVQEEAVNSEPKLEEPPTGATSSTDVASPASKGPEMATTPLTPLTPLTPQPAPVLDGQTPAPLRSSAPLDFSLAPPTIDVMESPRQGEEDEQQRELIRWFSQAVP